MPHARRRGHGPRVLSTVIIVHWSSIDTDIETGMTWLRTTKTALEYSNKPTDYSIYLHESSDRTKSNLRFKSGSVVE